MNLTERWLDAIDGINALDADVEFSRHGYRRRVDLTDVARVAFEDADPVRAFRTWPGKRNFEGRFWFSSTQQHVPFESFWERAFLASLDRTGSAVRVSSQPMWIHWRAPKRSHAPDYFVRQADGSGVLVDVKPKELAKEEDRAKFDLTRRLAAALGWTYFVFEDLPGATEANLRFLLRYRDPAWLEGVELADIALTEQMTLAQLSKVLQPISRSGRGAAYALIWAGVAAADLSRPLRDSTKLRIERAS